MGLCSSSYSANGLGRSISRQAMHDISNARNKDMKQCKPVFELLKFNKTMQKKIINIYESCCSGGKGNVNYLLEALRVDKAFHFYIMRSFTYFNPGGKSFTSPQFVVLVWNLLTLQMNADASAEWSFKVWFGGDTYASDATAERNSVFEMLDSSLGLSSKYDYRPKSEKNKMFKGFVGNSHDWDKKKGQLLMKSCCGDGDVDLKGWTKLAARAKPVCKFPFPVCDEFRTLLKSSKQWEKMTMGRRACNDLEAVIAQIKSTAPNVLDSVALGGGSSGGESSGRNGHQKKKHAVHVGKKKAPPKKKAPSKYAAARKKK